MSFLRRIFGGAPAPAAASHTAGRTVLVAGYDGLEVVGESFYQDNLRAIVGPRRDHVRIPVEAVLLAEANNQHDANAISVWIQGRQVGHLSREDAEAVRPGLLALQTAHRASIALNGVIVGGGEGRPSYGVFLDFDRTSFGLPELEAEDDDEEEDDEPEHRVPREPRATIRTGLHNAIAQDAQNDNFDLSWQSRIPEDRLQAISYIRGVLRTETQPISRHFLFAELAARLYQAREHFDSALSEFDEVCRAHDAEMEAIRPALVATFRGLPLLELYKQSAIRHQKAHDWEAALWWARRGLEVYGSDAVNADVTEDLAQRIANYTVKLAPPPPRTPRVHREPREAVSVLEVLVCRTCGQSFERERTRGRKPSECPACRGES